MPVLDFHLYLGRYKETLSKNVENTKKIQDDLMITSMEVMEKVEEEQKLQDFCQKLECLYMNSE